MTWRRGTSLAAALRTQVAACATWSALCAPDAAAEHVHLEQVAPEEGDVGADAGTGTLATTGRLPWAVVVEEPAALSVVGVALALPEGSASVLLFADLEEEALAAQAHAIGRELAAQWGPIPVRSVRVEQVSPRDAGGRAQADSDPDAADGSEGPPVVALVIEYGLSG